MRKLVVYRCENKCTDQLCNNKRLCFHFTNSAVALFLKSQMSSFKQFVVCIEKKVQVGKDQEKAQSEKDSHSKNRGGKKPN